MCEGFRSSSRKKKEVAQLVDLGRGVERDNRPHRMLDVQVRLVSEVSAGHGAAAQERRRKRRLLPQLYGLPAVQDGAVAAQRRPGRRDRPEDVSDLYVSSAPVAHDLHARIVRHFATLHDDDTQIISCSVLIILLEVFLDVSTEPVTGSYSNVEKKGLLRFLECELALARGSTQRTVHSKRLDGFYGERSHCRTCESMGAQISTSVPGRDDGLRRRLRRQPQPDAGPATHDDDDDDDDDAAAFWDDVAHGTGRCRRRTGALAEPAASGAGGAGLGAGGAGPAAAAEGPAASAELGRRSAGLVDRLQLQRTGHPPDGEPFVFFSFRAESDPHFHQTISSWNSVSSFEEGFLSRSHRRSSIVFGISSSKLF